MPTLPNPQTSDFPQALKAAREASGMSRAQLARAANIHAVMPRRYEEPDCGEFARPTTNTWMALNRALGFHENPLEQPVPRAVELLLSTATLEEIIAELHSRNVVPNFQFPQPTFGAQAADPGLFRANVQPKLEPRSSLSNEELQAAVKSIEKIGRAQFKGKGVTGDELFAHPEVVALGLSREAFEDALDFMSGMGGGRSYSIPGRPPLRMQGAILFGLASAAPKA